MSAKDQAHQIGAQIAEVWNETRLYDISCRTVVVSRIPDGANLRFGYVTAASDVERVVRPSASCVDARTGSALDDAAVYRRLVGHEAVAFIGDEKTITADFEPIEDAAFVERRQGLRASTNEMKFLLRQYALDELASHRGASVELVRHIADRWDADTAVMLDVAMQLSLGADRQRYTDLLFTSRFKLRIPAAHGRLIRAGVRSNPLLALD